MMRDLASVEDSPKTFDSNSSSLGSVSASWQDKNRRTNRRHRIVMIPIYSCTPGRTVRRGAPLYKVMQHSLETPLKLCKVLILNDGIPRQTCTYLCHNTALQPRLLGVTKLDPEHCKPRGEEQEVLKIADAMFQRNVCTTAVYVYVLRHWYICQQ